MLMPVMVSFEFDSTIFFFWSLFRTTIKKILILANPASLSPWEICNQDRILRCVECRPSCQNPTSCLAVNTDNCEYNCVCRWPTIEDKNGNCVKLLDWGCLSESSANIPKQPPKPSHPVQLTIKPVNLTLSPKEITPAPKQLTPVPKEVL